MKKTLIYFFALLFFVSCQKDKEPAKQLYLSKIFTDALLSSEYIYSSDKKPIRFNNYSTNTNQSVLNSFSLYGYSSEGLLSDVTIFTDDNQFNTKYTLEYDAGKRPVRMDVRDADNNITFYYLMDYGANNELSKYTLYKAGTNKKNVECFYTYDAKGTVSQVKRYNYPVNTAVLRDTATFSFSSRIPSHWKNFEALTLISLPNGNSDFTDLVCNGYNYTYIDAPPTITKVTYANRVYNKDGYLTKQQKKFESTYLGPAVITTFEKTYEYIE
ncbi:MAG: hypothetical protein ABI480_16590 [Chitinophagaceae bacterium]